MLETVVFQIASIFLYLIAISLFFSTFKNNNKNILFISTLLLAFSQIVALSVLSLMVMPTFIIWIFYIILNISFWYSVKNQYKLIDLRKQLNDQVKRIIKKYNILS